ncbi:hypothetical protein CEUSTIGMA_g12265.t1 [Chlamydomonas eustigma]|uniref:Apyrase n=1 Tax=Chlamydomonas eustigma TaxID=1157962 RepID=A0A250XP30_9CHLO|nr:hypothetical protein CEUSTIGMA_g12265.t1 [Chlamydomonas eustigma]|eukprot:GAX84844.1 hypothetical protein CEUSTIGMA_g12265.t1 [Chlamydomonas eustigma]
MRRPETLTEKVWRSVSKSKQFSNVFRYRGVLFVASIPIGLILLILLVVPNFNPYTEKSHTLAELHHDSSADKVSDLHQFAVVFDAGSTGSRVHIFKFTKSKNDLKLISDTFEQLKPGLSSYPDDPTAAALSLKPLMLKALETVPKHLQSSTPISLKATAGLRLLPGDKADKILEAVKSYLKDQPFSLADDAVSVLGGQDEGGFAWLTLNYLLGKLGGKPEDTVAAIDLGGGSVQEAFAVTETQAAQAPKGYTMKLKGGGKDYNVYVHSYLGYGLMAGRAKVIEAFKKKEGHPCFVNNYSGAYKYAGKDYNVEAAALQFEACSSTGTEALDTKAECGAVKDQCSFNGAWRGDAAAAQSRSYYISSYFWDRARDTGIIANPKATSFTTKVQDFSTHAQKACSSEMSTLSHVTKTYPDIQADAAPYLCLDLTYLKVLLEAGFKLPPTAQVTLVKQVDYDGQKIEAAWPLGAAINDLASR